MSSGPSVRGASRCAASFEIEQSDGWVVDGEFFRAPPHEPLRITRGDNFQSLNVAGLYPAGEGAGYAGGILSAGVDGIKVAEAVAQQLRG